MLTFKFRKDTGGNSGGGDRPAEEESPELVAIDLFEKTLPSPADLGPWEPIMSIKTAAEALSRSEIHRDCARLERVADASRRCIVKIVWFWLEVDIKCAPWFDTGADSEAGLNKVSLNELLKLKSVTARPPVP